MVATSTCAYVRVVSASFRDLRQFVNREAFREDLYHRLAPPPGAA
ncbi:MAG: sigma 54-interacting transcriptional regulator [Deltaproteobacteria bacterium]